MLFDTKSGGVAAQLIAPVAWWCSGAIDCASRLVV